MKEFTNEEIMFLFQNSIAHVKHDSNGTPVGVRNFIYTFGLITGYEAKMLGTPYIHRFCYPKTDFSVEDIVKIASNWCPDELPPSGWVKYKGVYGEFTPDDTSQLLKCLKSERERNNG